MGQKDVGKWFPLFTKHSSSHLVFNMFAVGVKKEWEWKNISLKFPWYFSAKLYLHDDGYLLNYKLYYMKLNLNTIRELFYYYYFPIIIIATISVQHRSQLSTTGSGKNRSLLLKMQHANGKAHKIKMISGHDVMRLSFWLR